MENIPNAEASLSDPWLAYFADRGHTGVRHIGAGVEGVVYGLGDGRVAKVWSGRPPADLDLIRQVYADIARHPLPFATPEILDVEDHDRVLVTYERELPGNSVRVDSAHTAYERELPTRHNDALLAVLRGLASVPGTDAMRQLTVQGDDRPLWRDHDCFRNALAALVARAAARHGAALAACVSDFDAGVERTQKALRSLPDAPVTAIHGDLVPPNIHIDPAGRPVAVLDFGFYTTAGDPAFEAAVTAAIWDMYGPHAEEHATELTGLFARELGYASATLTTYQAAYALTTYDLFGLGDGDGHFRWCAQQLRRNPVFSA
ncbi:aminoglycoside phosphotransferase family protein [Streptomyces guryensis]|uniref:Aminoglycoside phosphotransferase family protein n=1 Tax=Streptomyces guryensis TaxID=2886947 RepID=A0A9Q3VNX4_9ACTN|nr:aminoglycoside phosphotransferase family protein [Streptomyces guryensis]MCD9874748.1 aminoglycoside phosphotransferase family protein [Streptomyces guryensis]